MVVQSNLYDEHWWEQQAENFKEVMFSRCLMFKQGLI